MVIDMTERRLNWRLSMIQHVENVAGKVQYMFKTFDHFSGRGFKPHRRHCIVVFEQDTFILA